MDEATKRPVSNGARNIWVTETALSTALNTSYMADKLGLFGIVVGIALFLSGIGFIVLAYADCIARGAPSRSRRSATGRRPVVSA